MQSQVVERSPWIPGDSRGFKPKGKIPLGMTPPGTKRDTEDSTRLAKAERARAKAAASATTVARKATSNGNAPNFTAKVAKETAREAARACGRQRVVAKAKEADSKEIATIVASRAIHPENFGRAKGKEEDMVRQEERAA